MLRSWNHHRLRTISDTYGGLQSNPLRKAGPARSGCSGPRWVLNSSKDVNSTISLSNLVEFLTTFTLKMFSLSWVRNFPCSNLCPLPLVLLLCTPERCLSPSSLHPPMRQRKRERRFPSPLPAEQTQLFQLLLICPCASAPWPSWWPSTGLAQACPCLLCPGEPRTGCILQMWSHTCQMERKKPLRCRLTSC